MRKSLAWRRLVKRKDIVDFWWRRRCLVFFRAAVFWGYLLVRPRVLIVTKVFIINLLGTLQVLISLMIAYRTVNVEILLRRSQAPTRDTICGFNPLELTYSNLVLADDDLAANKLLLFANIFLPLDQLQAPLLLPLNLALQVCDFKHVV